MKTRIFLLIILISFLFCGKMESTNNTVPDNGLIVNAGFEKGGSTQSPEGWVSTGDVDADFTVKKGQNGTMCLEHSKSSPYNVLTSQTITITEPGYYSLTGWFTNSGGQNSCYLLVKDYGGQTLMTSLPVSFSWTKVIIRGIHITAGKCTIGIQSDANGKNWCRVDDLSLVKDDLEYQFLKGGDISELSYIESMGGKFYENGEKKDALQILKDNGFNLVRVRLYNDPGNPGFTPSNRLPSGFQDPADILRLSKRSKELGLKILLTFYYSDYWSNDKTHLWQNIGFSALKDSVYQFTFSFMNKMKAQGTTPEFVSLGNEIAGGILKPEGSSSNFASLAELLKQGYNAVKAASPSTRVVLHLDDAGNRDKYDWFFGQCYSYGVPYDIIGASYYPFWTKKTVAEMGSWAEYVSEKFQKDILIMETGYNWNPVLQDGKAGQLSNNGPYDNIYPSSPEGQLDFLYECFNGIKNVKNGRVIGDIYWDPVMIEVPGVGWELGADNVVSNTTLFDFNGNALKALKAFRFN